GCERRPCRPGDSPESELVRLARAGMVVGRLMSGDPFLGPTGEREVSEVARAQVPFEVVPGVPVLPAIAAYARVPPFQSSDASPSIAICAVDPGHESLHDWSRLARATDTLMVLTDVACLAEIARTLVFYERSPQTLVAIVTGLSTSAQQVTTCELE